MSEETLKEKEEKTLSTLDEIEQIMLEELRFYSNKDNNISAKATRLNVTDKMCKSANVILATENLKERRFMNRTERKSELRKYSKTKQ